MDPARTALLIMDMQPEIIERFDHGSAGGRGLSERLADAAQAARAAGMKVIYVTVGFRAGYPEVSPRNRMFALLKDSGRMVEGDSSVVDPRVDPQPGDVIVTKRRVSAFSGSDLDFVLRAAGIESLVLTGIATSGVVLSTLRQAADLDFDLTVLSDGCLDGDHEVHRVLCEKVFPRQAEVVTIEEWVQSLGRG